MQTYTWLKVFHVTALVTWMAGMIVVPAVATRTREPASIDALRRHLSRVTGPAMMATLVLGLWMAQDAGWFRSGWLQAKLVLVLALTALHGVLSGQMRRLAAEPDRRAPTWFGALPALIVALVLGIAALAVAKPVIGLH